MPRKPREFEVGGIYHIVNRGVEKRKIFLKNQDYSRFIFGLEFFNREDAMDLWNLVGGTVLPTLERKLASQRSKEAQPVVELLAFALMPNHFHLIIREIAEQGISLFMRKLGTGYSTYFNKQNDRVGPLFQSRYKSVHIKDNGQLATVFAYVHTNPVELVEPRWKDFHVENPKAAMRYLENYKWSSYRDYIGNSTFPTVTSRDFFLDFYGSKKKCQQVVEDWVTYKAAKTKLEPEVID